MPEITRHRAGRGFTYRINGAPVDSKEQLERIKNLRIPPAWNDVHIALSNRAKILAYGYDEAGRKQTLYNPMFRQKQEKHKFDRVIRFATALPKLRKRVEKDLSRRRLTKEKVVACAVKLIDEAYFRIGNHQYANQNQTYGITTLRSKHVDVSGYTVTFDFIGKSHQKHHKTISDRKLSSIVKQLDEQPGYELFQYQDGDTFRTISSNDVNNYIKDAMGDEFTAKDFRTWGGTLLAVSELMIAELPTTTTGKKKVMTACVKKVAQRLGNTPSVTRSSYIDPRVFTAYESGTALKKVREALADMRPRKYMSNEERCTLQLLASL